MRYGAGVLEWRFDKLKELDRKTRKPLTMHKVLYPKSDVDENNLGWYLKSLNESLFQGVKHLKILNLRDSVSKKDFKRLLNEKRVENWKEKQMYGQFIRDMPEGTDKEKLWLWLGKCDLKIPSEALICSAQEQEIRTNYVKYPIDKSVDSTSCRMCGDSDETISHIVSECSKLAQKE